MGNIIAHGKMLADLYLYTIKTIDQKITQASMMKKIEKYKVIGEDSYQFLLNQKRFLQTGDFGAYQKFMDEKALSLKKITDNINELKRKK